ncbi:MAG: hypothetical protein JO006_08730 [Paucibacter sp.]|nr:hypothetical protein [Roseateles sp.]
MPDREQLCAPELEQPLAEVEDCLERLGAALTGSEVSTIEQQAAHLHRALAQAVEAFRAAAAKGKVPAPLRNRLVIASGRMAAQRTVLTRANVSLDRAIEVLMPAEIGDVYGVSGKSDRRLRSGGSVQA